MASGAFMVFITVLPAADVEGGGEALMTLPVDGGVAATSCGLGDGLKYVWRPLNRSRPIVHHSS